MAKLFQKRKGTMFSNGRQGTNRKGPKLIFYMKSITSGLLYLAFVAKCEPVCYIRRELDTNNVIIKQTDCKIEPGQNYMSFASRGDIYTTDLLNWPDNNVEEYPSLPEGTTQQDWPSVSRNDELLSPTRTTQKIHLQATRCFSNDLPNIESGYFNCTSNSEMSEGDICEVTCDEGFYLTSSDKRAVCEAGKTNQNGRWSYTNFSCQAIVCSTNDLPNVQNGFFDCAKNWNVSKDDGCSLKCDDGFHIAFSDQVLCESTDGGGVGQWSDGNFVCDEIKCSEADLPEMTNGAFHCVSGPDIVVNDVCNISCDGGFYSFPSGKAVCQAVELGNGGQWSGGNSCRIIECDEWNQRSEKEYKFIGTFQDWNKSRQLCEGDNAHLVTIENEDDNDFLEKMILPYCNRHWGTWIGFSDLVTEGTWEWDSKISATYTNWDGSDPDGGYEENCAMMKSENGGWNDYPCHESFPTVCEKPHV